MTARSAHGRAADPATATDLDPLDFALGVMRDDGQPMALRASMAKAAMTAQKQDGGAETGEGAAPAEPRSDLELARRIAHILKRADDELRTRELAARGWDVKARGLPVDNTDWGRILARLMAIFGASTLPCTPPAGSLDRPGISD